MVKTDKELKMEMRIDKTSHAEKYNKDNEIEHEYKMVIKPAPIDGHNPKDTVTLVSGSKEWYEQVLGIEFEKAMGQFVTVKIHKTNSSLDDFE